MMTSKNPLVSVIIPTYNRAEIIGRAVDSVLRQTYENTEIIIVDDGSTDHTAQVLGHYDGRIRVLFQENAGPSAARNHGIEVASGEIISFLDSDDLWLPEKLSRQVALMAGANSDVACCICNARICYNEEDLGTSFGRSGIGLGSGSGYWLNPAPVLATTFLLFNQVVAVRRETLLKIGGFNPELRILEDYDLALRLALEGPWGYVGSPLVVKQEETEGIGVCANRDDIMRSRIWMSVLQGFLARSDGLDSRTRKLVARNLAQVEIEILGHRLAGHPSKWVSTTGRLLIRGLRAQNAVQRRMPWWPEAETLVFDEDPSSHSVPDIGELSI